MFDRQRLGLALPCLLTYGTGLAQDGPDMYKLYTYMYKNDPHVYKAYTVILCSRPQPVVV